MRRRVVVVYDAACPFCSRYARLMSLRDQFDVELVDARRKPEKAAAYDLDLNEGMIADVDGVVYHGAGAIWVLSRLSSRIGLLNRMMAQLFSSPWVARALYPILRLGRRATLILTRRPLI